MCCAPSFSSYFRRKTSQHLGQIAEAFAVEPTGELSLLNTVTCQSDSTFVIMWKKSI